MLDQIKTSILITLMFTVITGLVYPLSVTLFARGLFSNQANGSLITKSGNVIGSKLIGQNFTSPKYFHPRPSISNYDATISGGSNLAPTSKKLIDRIKSDAQSLQKENPNLHVPIDLVTISGSSLDPHITPEAARFQVPRIAKVRKIAEEKILELVHKYTEPRQFGIFGEPRVNVLLLNLALDNLSM